MLARWRRDYNQVRPHSALANRTPKAFHAHHLALAVSRSSLGYLLFWPSLFNLYVVLHAPPREERLVDYEAEETRTRLFTSQHIIGAFSHWREPMLHLPAMVWLAGFYPQIGSGTLRLLRSCGCSGTEWSEAMTRPRFLSPNAVRHLRDRPSRPHAGLSSRRSARAGRAPRCNRGCSGLRPCAMEPRFRPGLAI